MKITTYKKDFIDQEEKNLVEINNVKLIIITPLSFNKIHISYRLKNKEYRLLEFEKHEIPPFHHFEIREDE